MRRFKFGSGGKDDEETGGSEQAAEESAQPSSASETQTGGEEGSSRSWMSDSESEWVQPDKPAPVHSESQHDLEGAQTPESEVAHAEGPQGEGPGHEADEDAVEPLSEQPKEGDEDTLSREVPPPWEHQADRGE